MTTDQAYRYLISRVKSIYDAGEAATISNWVFENVTGINRLERVLDKHQQLPDTILQKLLKNLGELLQHRPVQYILGEAWFYKMKFFVNEAVLIPRPETEELVEWLVDDEKDKATGIKIMDVGTGSGCIAIALKKALPAAEIMAIEVSAGALSVAAQNALALGVNIHFYHLDFLDEKEWGKLDCVDVIISNPPYIPAAEKDSLAKNVASYEPPLALFVADAKPFLFYKKIALFAEQHLDKAGKIYVEVHEQYAKEVKEIFTAHQFTSIIRKDIYGRDRMIRAGR